jgi:hypothetical protein
VYLKLDEGEKPSLKEIDDAAADAINFLAIS